MTQRLLQVRDKTLELALINQMRKAKASLAALIIYKRSKKGVLQPAELTRQIALNSATAKRLIQESKRSLLAQSEAGVDTELKKDSSGGFKHPMPGDELEMSQLLLAPPGNSRRGTLSDRTKAVHDSSHGQDITQHETAAVGFCSIDALHQPDERKNYDGQGLQVHGTGLQTAGPQIPGSLETNAKVTLHRSSKNGYWVMLPVWVQVADDDLAHPQPQSDLQ
jgi:hypothetical protein